MVYVKIFMKAWITSTILFGAIFDNCGVLKNEWWCYIPAIILTWLL